MTPARKKRPFVVAHRGASGTAPENTLAAFRRALKEGADMIELDVRMTKDYHLVVLHDRDVKRTTNGRGHVWDLTLQQLRTLDAGSWFHHRFSNEQIPTLRQVFEMMPQGTMVNVEVKTDGDPRKRLALEEVVILIIMEKKFEERVLVSSFDHKSLARMHKLYPSIQTGALIMPVRDIRKTPSSLSRTLGTSAYICSTTQIRPAAFENAKAHNILTATYVVNTQDELENVLAHQVDAVITDYPAKILRALDTLGYFARPTRIA